VVDDFEMEISHVIRGEEHLSNTPRQILIQNAIGAPQPVYAHLPLVLAADRSKLSKRKHGETVFLSYYRNLGYLPQAIINFLALIGWNSGTDQEIFSLDELIGQFNIEKVQKGGAVFNVDKLNWLNREYMRRMPETEIINKIREIIISNKKNDWDMKNEIIFKISPIILNHAEKFADAEAMVKRGDLDYFFSKPDCDPNSLKWKDEKDMTRTSAHISKILELLKNIDDNEFTKENVKKIIWNYATEEGRGSVLWPMRYALSGKDKSPDPFELSEILGKKETIERLGSALRACPI